MTLGAVDLLFNMVVMLFWMRAWESGRRMAMFNPYLAAVENFTQPVLDTLARGLPGRSARLAAGVCWLLLIVFRGIALPLANPETNRQMWQARWGFETFVPGLYPAWPAAGGLIFSLASFSVFMFQVWCLALIYTTVKTPDRPADFLKALAEPWSSRPLGVRLAAILAGGTALTMLLNLGTVSVAGAPASVSPRPFWWLMRGLVNGLAGVADLLMVARSLMMILLIGSWVAMFGGGDMLMVICREWLDFLLGPFRRFHIQIAMLDLTPVIAFLALGVAHFLIYGYVLRMLYFIILNA